MRCGRFADAGREQGTPHGALHELFTEVVAPANARARIHRQAFGRKNVLPRPLSRRVAVLSFQSVRQIDRAKSFSKITFVQRFREHQLIGKRGHQPLR